jgi:hypothetical protein
MSIRTINGVVQFDANSDLHEFFVANPKTCGFANLFAKCNMSAGHNGTRKTARTLVGGKCKNGKDKGAAFENYFPRGVFHCYEMQVMLNVDYEQQVQRYIEKYGQINLPEDVKFESSPLPYGQWDIPGLVIMHQGGWHLRTSPTKDGYKELSSTYVDYDGVVIEPLLWDLFVKEFKAEKKQSDKQAAFGLAEEDQAICRNFKFDSIQELRVAGKILRRVGPNPLAVGE